jgi:dihydrodipicolinate synthase/N-acetylneuraminate lyase
MADEGDLDGAWKHHSTLGRERQAFQKWMRDQWLARGEGAIPIAELKTWLTMMGLPQGQVRPPLIPMSAERETELRADLEGLDLLESVSA